MQNNNEYEHYRTEVDARIKKELATLKATGMLDIWREVNNMSLREQIQTLANKIYKWKKNNAAQNKG